MPVRRSRWSQTGAVCAGLAAALLGAGCGAARQDAHEPSATFDMQLVHAAFPARQVVARPTSMQIAVRNSGTSTAPQVAVTVDSFSYSSTAPELASRSRPTWVIERGPGAAARPPVETQEVSQPGSGQTAYVNTWSLGALAAGQTRVFSWRVVPVRAGVHTVRFTVAAGLAGRARAQLAGGGPVSGQFRVLVAGAPAQTYVDPSTGRVRVGSAPALP